MGSAKKTISYRYDANRNRTLMIDPDGGRTTYSYDALNRITSLINPQGERTTYAYDAKGRRTVKKLANGARASFTYDAANRITTLANLKSDNTVISKFDYKYDNVGNRTEVAEADGSRVTWSYDATYQLTAEHRTGTVPYRNTFTYDSVGNRLLKNETGVRTTYSYDAANQLETSIDASGTTTYTFDADGNQQLVQAPNNDRTTTTWDYENKTTLVELPTGIRNTMAYEPDGLRVKLEESAGTKKFIWDDQNYLAESDENDDINVVYTNEPNYYGNLVSQYRKSGAVWTPSYYHYEALGSTRELTDNSEAVTDNYIYDAWGYVISSSGTTIIPFQFTGNVGYHFDVDTEIQYIRARTYLASIARWGAVDLLWREQSTINPYLFGSNSPVMQIDPSGFLPKSCIPDCGAKCGPDVGKRLRATMELAIQTWCRTPQWKKLFWCSNPSTWLSWDLGAECRAPEVPGHSECGACHIGTSPNIQTCVKVYGYKHNEWSVNYMLWGVMSRLCGMKLGTAYLFTSLHKHAKYLAGTSECGHELTDTLQKWIYTGYMFPGSGGGHQLCQAKRNPISRNMPSYNDPMFDGCSDCPSDDYPDDDKPCRFRWFNNNDVEPSSGSEWPERILLYSD
ncbi:RHS repeat domain-containing protein [Thalassoglobus sp.]|uniref:RHS repeat domain-containing protein n=1 Tax=Thalassoglobus sp. TaxID=2795869 RepID=UPI003AA87F83